VPAWLARLLARSPLVPRAWLRRAERQRDDAAALAVGREADLRRLFAARERQNARLREELDALREVVRRIEWRADLDREVGAIRQHIHAIRGAAQ
jgi:hypothetical protein